MIVTITNVSSPAVTLNALDVNDGGSGAVGGSVKNPLPYPFPGPIGTQTPSSQSLAPSGTFSFPMHPRDWRYKRVPWLTFEASDQWNSVVQAGLVTMGVAAETGRRDQEELFFHGI